MSRKKRYVPDLVSDMAECDANYIRLLRLFPDMPFDDDREFGVEGVSAENVVATLHITERCRYTTMLSMKVRSENHKFWVKWPVLDIRVYHDIKSAEVVSFERHRNFKYRYATPNADMFHPDEKSQINRFLGELLTWCLENGHALDNLAKNPAS